MTKTTWPFPDRPGLPLNPEKDGWHWVNLGFSIINPTPCPVLWRPRMGWTSPLQKRGPDDYIYPEAYLGPCLTPEGIAAKDARIAELEAALREAKQHFVADEPLKAFIEICAALGGKDE